MRTIRWPLGVLFGLAAIVALGGCASARTAGTSTPSAPSTPSAMSTPSVSSPSTAMHELRGTVVSAPDCRTPDTPPLCPTGPLPSANVSAYQADRLVSEAKTSSTGEFALKLPPGRYAVSVTGPTTLLQPSQVTVTVPATGDPPVLRVELRRRKPLPVEPGNGA